MADIKGIELASDIYGLEDETARNKTETNTSAIGTLANLLTTVKTNIVAAINEIFESVATIISLIPSTASSTNKLVTADTVAPAITDTKIENLQQTIQVESDVSISSSYFQQSGQTFCVGFNTMSVATAKNANALLCELPSSVPAPKNLFFFELFDTVGRKMIPLFYDGNRCIRTLLPLSERVNLIGSLIYL